jgi:hypothetical protein
MQKRLHTLMVQVIDEMSMTRQPCHGKFIEF